MTSNGLVHPPNADALADEAEVGELSGCGVADLGKPLERDDDGAAVLYLQPAPRALIPMPLIHYNKAAAAVGQIKDPTTKQLVMRALALVAQRYAAKKETFAEFDLLVFVSLQTELMSQHDVLKRILAGEDLRLFSDD